MVHASNYGDSNDPSNYSVESVIALPWVAQWIGPVLIA